MEDYTYHLVPGEEKILGAHMLEVCPVHRGGQADARDPPARHRRPRGPGPARLRRGPRRGRRSSASPTSANASASSPTRSTVVAPDAAAAQPPGRASRLATGPGPPHVDRGLADGRRTAPHGALDRAHDRAPGRPRGDDRDRAGPHRRRHHRPLASAGSCGGTRPTTGWRQGTVTAQARDTALWARDGPGSPTQGMEQDSAKSTYRISRRRQPGARASRRAAATTAAAVTAATPAPSASPCRPSRRSAGSPTATTSRSSSRPPATRSTCSTPRTTSRPRSPRSRTWSPRAPTILVIAAIDGTALGDVLETAESQDIPVIAYDRLIRDSDTVDYYTTFDNFKVGVLQAESLVDGPRRPAVTARTTSSCSPVRPTTTTPRSSSTVRCRCSSP